MLTPLYDLNVLSSHWTGDWSVYFNYALADSGFLNLHSANVKAFCHGDKDKVVVSLPLATEKQMHAYCVRR